MQKNIQTKDLGLITSEDGVACGQSVAACDDAIVITCHGDDCTAVVIVSGWLEMERA